MFVTFLAGVCLSDNNSDIQHACFMWLMFYNSVTVSKCVIKTPCTL